MHHILAIKVQNFVKTAKTKNIYNSFSEVTPKHFTFGFLFLTFPRRSETKTFWHDLTKAAVTVVCFGKFVCNLAV